MTNNPADKPFKEDDDAMLEKKKSALTDLSMPIEESFNGNTMLFQNAMEEFFEKKRILESEIEHLESEQRKIARGDLKGGFGIN